MRRRVRSILGVLLTLVLLVAGTAYGASAENVLYVKHDAQGSNDGSSWTDAYTDLQDALTRAVSGDEIWVAQGVYYPAPDASDRTSTFELEDGVALYGGFAGIETERDQRDWKANATVLSGDLDRNDFTDANGVLTDTAKITGTNACNVVEAWSVTETAMLDGFSITAGRANCSDGYHWYGAGMHNSSGSPTLTNVTFSGNWAMIDGGGMANRHGSPTLTNVIFTRNRADQGGGMRDNEGGATLTDVTFSGNRSNMGGGMNSSDSNSRLTNVTFSGNRANIGGGMFNWPDNPTLVNVIFTGNTAEYNGGGMYNWNGSNPTLTNCIFSGNNAHEYGGGMYSKNGSSPMLTNVTLSGNQAAEAGGGIYSLESSTTLVNSILWGNSPENIYVDVESSTNVTYSNIGLPSDFFPGVGNINQDPLFIAPVSADQAPTTAGNYRPSVSSPAIDAGTNDVVTVGTDLAGRPRIVDGTGDGSAVVDMGAYEFQNLFAKVYLPLVLTNR